jgi:hypothetical protein
VTTTLTSTSGTENTLSVSHRRPCVPADLTLDPWFDDVVELARGGMGRVVRAIDRRVGRAVAIKQCLSSTQRDYDRLAREAAVMALFEHPSIPPVYELGRSVAGAPYLVSKLIRGATLEQHLRDQPASWPSWLSAIAEVADVVSAVHARGVVHRDLKPSNLLVGDDGRVYLIDWGLARSFTGTDNALTEAVLTAPGTAIGTPGYWSPEQRDGQIGGVTTDVYSLGATLYRMVTGEPARGLLSTGAALEIAMTKAPGWLTALVTRATDPEPTRRHPSVAAFAAELRRGIAGMVQPRVPEARVERRPTERDDAPEATAPPRRTGMRVELAAAILVSTWAGAVPSVAHGTSATTRAMLTSGRWAGDYGFMAFSVDGDRVRGVYDHDQGLFEGRIEDGTISGRWCEEPFGTDRDRGSAEFEIVIDGSAAQLRGRFRYADDADFSGRWSLEHEDAAASGDLQARLASQPWQCP